MKKCDDKLAALFGDPGAYLAANGFDFTLPGYVNGKPTAGVPQFRGDYTDNGRVFSGHLSSYAAHLYGSKDGSKKVTNVYIPWYKGINPTRLDAYEKDGKKFVLDEKGNKVVSTTVDLIYYSKLENLTDVTLAVLHINRVVPKQVENRLLLGTADEPGGEGAGDVVPHAHLEILPGRKTTFPAKRDKIPFSKLCL